MAHFPGAIEAEAYVYDDTTIFKVRAEAKQGNLQFCTEMSIGFLKYICTPEIEAQGIPTSIKLIFRLLENRNKD